jgi:hypothetical protein
MEQLDLQPIEDRLANCSQGVWFEDKNGYGVYCGRGKDCQPLASAFVHTTRVRSEQLGNRTLIANAPQDMRAMVEEIKRLRIALKLRGHSTAETECPEFNMDQWLYGDYLPADDEYEHR